MLKLDKYLILFFCIPFFLDRVTKFLVMHGLIQQQDITSFLEIYLIYNRGVSWGIGSSSSQIQFYIVSALVVLVIAVFAWHAQKHVQNRFEVVASWMVFAGAISNVIDRVRFGGVVDFIHIHYEQWSFPVFNIADVFISCGICMLFVMHIKNDQ